MLHIGNKKLYYVWDCSPNVKEESKLLDLRAYLQHRGKTYSWGYKCSAVSFSSRSSSSSSSSTSTMISPNFDAQSRLEGAKIQPGAAPTTTISATNGEQDGNIYPLWNWRSCQELKPFICEYPKWQTRQTTTDAPTTPDLTSQPTTNYRTTDATTVNLGFQDAKSTRSKSEATSVTKVTSLEATSTPVMSKKSQLTSTTSAMTSTTSAMTSSKSQMTPTTSAITSSKSQMTPTTSAMTSTTSPATSATSTLTSSKSQMTSSKSQMTSKKSQMTSTAHDVIPSTGSAVTSHTSDVTPTTSEVTSTTSSMTSASAEWPRKSSTYEPGRSQQPMTIDK